MKIRLILFALAFVVLLFSCENRKGEVATISTQEGSALKLKYAELFQLQEEESGYIIDVFSPWKENTVLISYCLHRNSLEEAKADFPDKDRYIQIPIASLALHSSSDIGYIKQLQKLHLLKGIADVDWIYSEEIRNEIENGNVRDIGPSADVNFEILQALQADVYIRPAFEQDQAWESDTKMETVSTFFNLDWKETHPLGRAEWILLFGALLDDYQSADSLFQTTVEEYNTLKSKVQNSTQKPDVLVGANYKGIWYLPSGGSFKATLLEDAGADYHWKEKKQRGSLSLNFENVLQAQSNAEIWIEAPAKSKTELLAMDERYVHFDAFKKGRTYHNLKRVTPSGGNDYWETGLSKPNLILHDLVNIFHPEILDDKELIYYQLLDE